MNCRWEDRADLFIDARGEEVRARARVYIDQDVELGGYLYLGISTASSPVGVDGAYEIRDFRKTPNLAATEFERRAML